MISYEKLTVYQSGTIFMTNKQPKRKARPGIDEYGRNSFLNNLIDGKLEKIRKDIEHGINIDFQDDNGWTAFHFASQEGHIEVIKLLVEKNANPNLHDIHGNGPLWTALMNSKGKMDIVEILLDAGADAKHKNKHGRSPLNMAMTIKNGIDKPFIDRNINEE